MSSLMEEFARRENAAAKKAWKVGEHYGDWAKGGDSAYASKQPIRERIVPFIGSGMTQNDVAQILGCTRGAIVRALKQLGTKL